MKLTSHLYELEMHDKITAEDKVKRLKKILDHFEKNSAKLYEDMITYHLLESKLENYESMRKKSTQHLYHINMKFNFSLN